MLLTNAVRCKDVVENRTMTMMMIAFTSNIEAFFYPIEKMTRIPVLQWKGIVAKD